MTTIYS